MRTRAALLLQQPGKWEIHEVDLQEPKQNEVLVRLVASGLCHSDDHMAKGDFTMSVPRNGGHEGGGIVEAVGPGVTMVEVGDHIVTSFIPSCGLCRWCSSGMQQLCDVGAKFATGAMPDGTFRMFLDGQPVAKSGSGGTFAEMNVMHELSCIKVPKDIPLDAACLVGCGVPTGYGSAVNAAGIAPGDVVIVLGIGGLGANAIQGSKHVGASRIIAVDTFESKRAPAQFFGATDFFTDMGEATELARSLTNGQGADAAIITIGKINGEAIGQAFSAIRKAGTVVVTSVGNMADGGIPVSFFELAMYQKRIQGVVYGNSSPRLAVPRLLDMYRQGTLKLDELITTRYSLDQINQGYEDMHDGKNIRGIIEF